MNTSGQNFSGFFSHIYIENAIKDHPLVSELKNRFKQSSVTYINKYTDISDRRAQCFPVQKSSPALILAKKTGTLVYPGAKVCQSFGNEHFYYTSNIMNCIYDCEYCYLQGMYHSAHIVVFVNLEDIFAEVLKLLKMHPVYLCISYDTDLLGLEGLLGYCRRWLNFTRQHENLTVELRTKAPLSDALKQLLAENPCDRFIFAFTVSPEIITDNFEHRTGSLRGRLAAADAVIKSGFSLRLCFDPLIYIPGFEEIYSRFIDDVFSVIPSDAIKDVSLGVFRVSADYMKTMRKNRINSPLLQFPYENDNGVCHYGKDLSLQLIAFVKEKLMYYVSDEKIFTWAF